jgi:hypothetical protein
MLLWRADRVKEKHRVTFSIILAFLKFENIQWKNNISSIFFAGEKIPRIVYFVAKRVGFTEVLNNEIICREIISEKYVKYFKNIKWIRMLYVINGRSIVLF